MAEGIIIESYLSYAPGRTMLANARRSGADLSVDIEYKSKVTKGIYQVLGSVAINGSPDTPVSRKIRLYHKNYPMRLAEETWSDADGSYSFDYVDRGPWSVISFDHTGVYADVIAGSIYGEPM